jgi:hydrogenase expression/formation protein HypC
MCLGVPGKVVDIYNVEGVRMGKVDFGGLVKEVCLAYVPEVMLDDYTIVHVGFAITQLDEQSAQESLDLLRQIRSLEEELGVQEQIEEQEGGQATHALS